MGKKQPIPWVFAYPPEPAHGAGRWGRRLLGRGWNLIVGAAKASRTPAGLSLVVFLVAMTTGYLLYPLMLGPETNRVQPGRKTTGAAKTSSVRVTEPDKPPAVRSEAVPKVVVAEPAGTAAAPQEGASRGMDAGESEASGSPRPAQGTPPALEPARLPRPIAGGLAEGPGWRKDPVYGDWRYHGGQDIDARDDRELKAVWSGEVAGISSISGGCVGASQAIEILVDHGGGWIGRYRARGAPAVSPRQSVTEGSTLIRLEGPGRVHFDLMEDGEHVNLSWFAGKAVPD